MDVLEGVQKRAIKKTKGLECLSYEEKLGQLGLISLDKAQGDPVSVYKYLKGRCKEDRARPFLEGPSDRTGGNGHKFKHRKLCLSIRRNFFTVRVTECWDRLPREVVVSPSLKIFKSDLDMVLGN